MDPSRPRARATAEDIARLQRVQRWVLSALVMTTILHLSAGLVIAAVVIDDSQRGAQVGLNILAAAFGVISIASAFAIHRKSLATPWLALGVLPGIVGLMLVL